MRKPIKIKPEKIKTLRKELGLSQAQLVEGTPMSLTRLKQLEKGQAPTLSDDEVTALCTELKTTRSYLEAAPYEIVEITYDDGNAQYFDLRSESPTELLQHIVATYEVIERLKVLEIARLT